MDRLLTEEHRKILAPFIPADPTKQRKAVMVTGYPGSGKSTILRQKAKEMDAILIDSDSILFELKAYKRSSPAAYKEYVKNNHAKMDQMLDDLVPIAENLAQLLFTFAIAGNYAMALQSMDLTADLRQLHENKYFDIEIILMNVDMRTAYKRSREREKKTKLPISAHEYQSLFYSLYPDFIQICSRVPDYIAKKTWNDQHLRNGITCSVYDNDHQSKPKKIHDWVVGVGEHGHLEVWK